MRPPIAQNTTTDLFVQTFGKYARKLIVNQKVASLKLMLEQLVHVPLDSRKLFADAAHGFLASFKASIMAHVI